MQRSVARREADIHILAQQSPVLQQGLPASLSTSSTVNGL
jgi:hypothetical protein